MHVEQVMFRSGQVRCAGDLYLPDGIDDLAPAPAVVMGHSVTMVKEALAPHAEYLVRAGFVVLAIDYRTIGSSEGQPRCQWLPERQVEDMRAGLSYLRTRAEVDPERIGLWGHSTGAGVAIVAGAVDRRAKCVAGQNPSMLDAWAALERSRGRAQMGAVRAMLEQDVQRRFETGEGAVIPALPAGDPKLAGYLAQAEELGIGAAVLLALWWSDALVVALTGFAMASGGVLGWVHHEDAAAATVAAPERGRPGQVYNLVDDLPATWQEVYTAMAEAFGVPPPRRLPRWLFRLAAPYVASFAIDTSMRVSNAKAKAELGWRPAYRTYHDGIGAAASKEVPWRSHGRSGAGTRSA